MKHRFLTLFALLACSAAYAQLPPIITAWKINTTGATGYNNIAANVQSVQYSTNNVYVSCTDVPDYSIGPWGMNPNVASNQNFVYKFTRNPQKNNGTLTAIGLGHTGALLNGVSIFNCDDGMTYNNDGVWHRNAYVFEGQSLDACGGHPQQDGEYHNHYNPSCVYDIYDSTHHSPLLGFMFDGYPVYGIYAYSDTDGTGPIRIMQSSYQLRNITDRTTLPDGSTASATGPAISSTYPLGSFLQDYVYVAGSGDLDEHNGRWCVTPEYPNGTYAYFFSVDATLTP
ncbi:MAG TPA: YHYH protein, partial [Chitinophagales bacterium]|nr:YHYH protein [Chitinophagales bacterium]